MYLSISFWFVFHFLVFLFFFFCCCFFGWVRVVYKSINLPELKCERFVVPFSVSLSSGRLRESPISGLGHVSIPASGSAAISTINPQFIRTLGYCTINTKNAQALNFLCFCNTFGFFAWTLCVPAFRLLYVIIALAYYMGIAPILTKQNYLYILLHPRFDIYGDNDVDGGTGGGGNSSRDTSSCYCCCGNGNDDDDAKWSELCFSTSLLTDLRSFFLAFTWHTQIHRSLLSWTWKFILYVECVPSSLTLNKHKLSEQTSVKNCSLSFGRFFAAFRRISIGLCASQIQLFYLQYSR